MIYDLTLLQYRLVFHAITILPSYDIHQYVTRFWDTTLRFTNERTEYNLTLFRTLKTWYSENY